MVSFKTSLAQTLSKDEAVLRARTKAFELGSATWCSRLTSQVGIERILRLFQSICHIAISYPIVLTFFLSDVAPPNVAASIVGITALRSYLNISRRFIRLFRFLDSFHAGWVLYVAQEKSLETWLDIISKTCLGIYGFLESATMLDVLSVDELTVFGQEKSKDLNYQAQILWFTALYASVIASGIKLFHLFAYQPVPQTGEGYGTGEKPAQQSVDEKSEAKDTSTVGEKQPSDEDELKKERERLKDVVAKRKEERREWIQKFSAQATGLGKKMASETLDMLLPAAAVGWVNVHPGLVGLAMFCTTIITGLDVWHRCGRDLEKKRV